MAINWTNVEGYREDMTAEEKLSLLENMPEPEPAQAPAPENMVTKKQFDKVSSELAAAKKELRSRMSDDEKVNAERMEREASMREELENLRKEKTLSTYKANYLAQGYDESMAEMAATAMAENDMAAVFAIMGKHQQEVEKNLRAKILKETPVPPAGNDPNNSDTKNKEELNQIRKAMGLPVLP